MSLKKGFDEEVMQKFPEAVVKTDSLIQDFIPAIKEKMPEAVRIFIEPPSIAELVQRLKLRNTETTAELQERLKNAETEMGLAGNYDYVVINDDVERAVDELVGIVKAEKRANKSEGDN